ncbi:MAG: hypothetical protein JKX69_10015 [Rhodobacteraceae bacterium]|nr:hypothetical protein [Paracoccaceae bacterium]
MAGLVAGCDTTAGFGPSPVPDSGAGVGLNEYSQYELDRARREAALTGAAGSTSGSIVPPNAAGVFPGPDGSSQPAQTNGTVSTGELSAAGIGPTQTVASTGDPNRTNGVQASPSNAAPVIVNNSGISDEQDFAAVSGRESIESDAARIAQNRDAYEVVQPTALPERTGDTGPNIVAYALNAPNQRGQEWYSRSVFTSQNRFQRHCASYRSPDDAQRDFLARGGPERDPRGIDPDGDGFACGWDPAPFRLAGG